MAIETRVETITPEIAEEYLKRNKVNRIKNDRKVAQYAYDMKQGAWQLNGEAIRFDSEGNLKDGQHRLYAIKKSGVPVCITVMRNVDPDVSIYDRGRNRSTTDSMIIDGMDRSVANETNVSIAKLHYLIQTSSGSMSDYQVREFLTKHQETLAILKKIRKTHSDPSCSLLSTRSASILLACLYAIESGEDPQDVADFLRVYSTGMQDNANQRAAIVARNDILGHAFIITGASGRIKVEKMFEKAIYDFCRAYPRTKSYKNIAESTYSDNIAFKES